MGQYYQIINMDKQEVLHPDTFDCGAKLTEWSFNENDFVQAFLWLMTTSWKGDRVYVIGDYAEPNEYSDKDGYTGILRELIGELGIRDKRENGYPVTIYRETNQKFTPISPFPENFPFPDYRYIYNHEKKQMIDLLQCPVSYAYNHPITHKETAETMAPLPLLMAMGNGQGGGDYWIKRNMKLVGSWADDSQHIEITEEPLDLDYEVFRPDFTEEKDWITKAQWLERQKDELEDEKV